jgi:Bacteriophage Mu Gam like protein
MNMSNKLDEITARAKAFADARSKLEEYVRVLADGIEQLRRDNLPKIRRAITRAAELEAELKQLVEASPEHFTRPRTIELHGIQLGFKKSKGTVVFSNPEKVVELIEKKLPEMVDILVKTEKKPLKGPLQKLTVQQLKSIGCEVKGAGDQVVVRAVDNDIEKLVQLLLKGEVAEESDT